MNKVDILKFISKIITSEPTSINDCRSQNLESFINYLYTSDLIDKETLDILNKIKECLPELISIYKKTGNLDENVLTAFSIGKVKVLERKKVVKKEPERPVVVENHYHSYYNDDRYSSSCGGGGGSSYGRSC